jgi:hypothetical protein
MFTFLSSLRLYPVEFAQATAGTGAAAPYIGEVLDRLLGTVQAVVVLFTGDEVVRLREALCDATRPEDGNAGFQARANVLSEAGLALGLKPRHTILVQMGPHRPFSDIAGRHIIQFDGSGASRAEVATRLVTAGCPVDRTGRDWLNAGHRDFDDALRIAATS